MSITINIGFERNGVRVQGTATSARGPMPVRWEMNITIRNAPGQSSPIRGLSIEDFRNEAAGWDDFRTLRRNATFEGDNAHDQPISGSVGPPRNAGGAANMTFWVMPADAQTRGAYAFSTRTPIADTSSESICAAENQTVKATLEVDPGAATIGEVTRDRTRTDGAQGDLQRCRRHCQPRHRGRFRPAQGRETPRRRAHQVRHLFAVAGRLRRKRARL